MELSWERISLLFMHEWRVRENASEATRKIIGPWGDDADAERTAMNWFAKFRIGENSLENQSRSGRSQEALVILRTASLAFSPGHHFCMSRKRIFSRVSFIFEQVAHSVSVFGLACSPCGQSKPTASGDRIVKIWNASGKALDKTITFGDPAVDNQQGHVRKCPQSSNKGITTLAMRDCKEWLITLDFEAKTFAGILKLVSRNEFLVLFINHR
ncbi:hypothetical protein KIN20_025603 [Parelaphostrongylus tenuis]|uniref:Mos1 transposase HTH domain-containing protein n=1 Tax=Parelaphostrongylus tenuis TaxID=148309 RepID=A0AAD5QX20_PARTN|nr:hypothetical protein KIN20_025603 [Parelaphostrongylus tenuis]